MLTSIEVRTRNRVYPVHIGERFLASTAACIRDLTDRVFVITDSILSELYLGPLSTCLGEAGIVHMTRTLPPGEHMKTMSTASKLYQFLTENHASRSDALLALGGGVIGDLVGFVASTFKRGVCLIHLPTSLLAQVDSAIGGKTAVNLPEGKNLVGTFYQPHAVFTDVASLLTLPENAFIGGLAEVIKYGVIMDSGLLNTLESSRSDILSRDLTVLAAIVERCVRNKAKIIADDEREERGRREVLNFGHTIGHAIETQTDHRVSHGSAVAIGMVAEARFAVREGHLEATSFDRLVSLLSHFSLPTEIPSSVTLESLEGVIRQDKKMRGGKLMLPIPNRLGEVKLRALDSPYALLTEQELK